MISKDLRFAGFDARSWTNLISLFAPGVVDRIEGDSAVDDAPEIGSREQKVPPGDGQAAGNLVIVHDGRGRVLKAFHTGRGRVRGLSYDGAASLPALAEATRARRAIAVRAGVMEEIAERLALRLERGDDYVTQWLALARVIREMHEAGLVAVWPHPWAGIPIPASGTVRRALDIVMPDGHSAVLAVFHRGAIWTTVAGRRRAGELDFVAGPDLLAEWTGPLGGDFRRDHRIIVDAVSRVVAPVHLGIFAERDTLRSLLANPEPGAWIRAIAVRDVIVQPTPPYIAVALGADAVRAVAKRSSRLLGGFNIAESFAPVSQYLRRRVAEVTSVTDTLGFNPLAALAATLTAAGPQPVEDSIAPTSPNTETSDDQHPARGGDAELHDRPR